jgi:hypothetical protein
MIISHLAGFPIKLRSPALVTSSRGTTHPLAGCGANPSPRPTNTNCRSEMFESNTNSR